MQTEPPQSRVFYDYLYEAEPANRFQESSPHLRAPSHSGNGRQLWVAGLGRLFLVLHCRFLQIGYTMST